MSEPVRVYNLIHKNKEGATSACIVPAWGCNLIALSYKKTKWREAIPILETVDLSIIALKPTSYGIPILGPTAGRVGTNQNGKFNYKGKQYIISPSRHGFFRDMAWSVIKISDTELTSALNVDLSKESKHVSNFPYKLYTEVSIQVYCGSIRYQLKCKNTGDQVQPISFGFHPYFHSTRPSIVKLPVKQSWVLDTHKEPTPTGELKLLGREQNFFNGLEVTSSDHWDDIFTDIEYLDGRAVASTEEEHEINIGYPNARRLHVKRWISFKESEYPHIKFNSVQLYTPPGRNAIAIEPLTSPPNAINLDDKGCKGVSLCELQPKEVIDIEFNLGIDIL